MGKKIAILLLAVITMIPLNGCSDANAEEIQSPTVKAQTVETEIVTKGNISRNISYNGTLAAQNTIHVIAKIPGEILSVAVKVGDNIEKDSPIYILDKKDIKRNASNASLTYQAAKHQVNATTDQHVLAEKTFERMKSLYENPNGAAISKSDYEQAELAASSSALEATKAQMNQAKIGMDIANDQLEDADLKTPISGIVSAINVEAGQTIGAGTHVADIINMDKVYVEIQVSEGVINNLEKGKEIPAFIPAISSEKIIGNIEWVSPAANVQTRLFPVRITFDNPNHTIKPGMFANISIDLDEASNSIIIPSTAILTRVDSQIVFLNNNGIAKSKEVITGFDNGEFTVILEGLEMGDPLIVEGQQYIEDGTPLKELGGE